MTFWSGLNVSSYQGLEKHLRLWGNSISLVSLYINGLKGLEEIWETLRDSTSSTWLDLIGWKCLNTTTDGVFWDLGNVTGDDW